MIRYLTHTIVSLDINGQRKSFLNSNKNREYLKKNLEAEEWNQILQTWGEKPCVKEEQEIVSIQLLEKLQNEKIQQLKNECMKTITNGIEYNNEHYSFEITDQLNLSRLAIQAKEGREQIIYHADGKPCRFYSAEEIVELNKLMEEFIEYHTTYFNSLKAYIKTLKYQSQILAIYYGMEIPTMSIVLQTLIEQ